jgi:hypothetical protein
MREPVEGTKVSSVARTLKRCVVSLTGTITASFIVSSLFLGSMTNYKLEPLSLIAIVTAILLLSLIFLGTNLPSSTTQTEKSISSQLQTKSDQRSIYTFSLTPL